MDDFIQNMSLKGKMDTRKWQVVTPVYFSAGLLAALLHSSRGGGVVTAHVNSNPPFPIFLPLRFYHVKFMFSRQLVVVQSDRRGQRSVMDKSCTELCLLIGHGW